MAVNSYQLMISFGLVFFIHKKSDEGSFSIFPFIVRNTITTIENLKDNFLKVSEYSLEGLKAHFQLPEYLVV